MDTQTIVKTPLHHTSSTQNNSTFQDISFSSYLKPKDPTPNSQETDAEISIFDAHKYFNETIDSKEVPRSSSVTSADGYRKNFRTISFHGTPKTSSEVSCNSQTGLLSNRVRNSRSNERISVVKKWIFGRKCWCSCKKSVQVKEVNSISERRKPVVLINNQKINDSNKASYLHTKSDHIMEIHRNKVSLLPDNIPTLYQSSQCRISASGKPFIDGPIGFTFPILNPCSDKGIIAKPIIKPFEDPSMYNPIAKPMRTSLEDPSMDNPVYRGTSVACDEDDVGSDASSDLFEIESFSNQTTLYRKGDSLDEDTAYDARRSAPVNGINNNIQCSGKSLKELPAPAPAPAPAPVVLAASVASTGCYPPSEVASASGIGEVDSLIGQRVEEAGDDGGKRKLVDNTVMVMSCRQDKAVSLGPQPVKCVAEGPPMFPLHVGGRPPRADKLPLGSASQSVATRLSPAFAA